MRLADDLLQLYLRHFENNNDQESLDLFIQSVLEQMDEKDFLEVFQSCKKEELTHMLGKYLRTSIEHELKYGKTRIGDNNDQLSI